MGRLFDQHEITEFAAQRHTLEVLSAILSLCNYLLAPRELFTA